MPSRKEYVVKNKKANRMPDEVVEWFKENNVHKHSDTMRLLRGEVKSKGRVKKKNLEGNKDPDFSLTRAKLRGDVNSNFDEQLAATRILGITRKNGRPYFNIGSQTDIGEYGYVEPTIKKDLEDFVNNLKPNG